MQIKKSSNIYNHCTESDFSFAINSASDFESASESDSESESDFSSVFMNQDICIFFILFLDSSK